MSWIFIETYMFWKWDRFGLSWSYTIFNWMFYMKGYYCLKPGKVLSLYIHITYPSISCTTCDHTYDYTYDFIIMCAINQIYTRYIQLYIYYRWFCWVTFCWSVNQCFSCMELDVQLQSLLSVLYKSLHLSITSCKW